MGEPISIFSGYDQKENRNTNYCLLMLRMIYEESPRMFQRVMAGLDDGIAGLVGVRFHQQSKRGDRILDGVITQPAFQVFVETKNYDWFYDAQLKDQLRALDACADGYKLLIALSSFESVSASRFAEIQQACADDFGGRVRFVAVTFVGFVASLRGADLTPALTTLVDELEEYLDRERLLPRWRCLLDVVNVSQSYQLVLDLGAYICPATSGPYDHRRCRYFGLYKGKEVRYIAEIEAVVDLLPSGQLVRWANVDIPDPTLVARALQIAQRWGEVGSARVFLLGTLCPTSFFKDSKGGLYGSKRYFQLSEAIATSAGDLAEALRGRGWSELLDGLG